MMRTVTVGRYEVRTNLRESGVYTPDYPMCDGNDKANMTMILLKWRETPEQAIERLAPRYKRVTFYRVTTAVRGIYNTIAFGKEREDY